MNTGFFFSVWYWIIGGLLVLFVGVSVYMIAARPIQLQESVERATADLRVAKEEAEAASQAKSEFLSSMSHELRTPLNAVLGFTQMLEYNTEEPLTKSQQEYATHIKQGGNHLLSLIENVLDLAKIEAGETQISLEDVPPNEVVNECISLVETIARDHGVAISFANSKSRQQLIRADYTRLKQVILNLLANAVKYNRADGRIEIGIATLNGGKIRISIFRYRRRNPEDRHGELFLPFNRLGAERSETPGTGIGLSITKNSSNSWMDGSGSKVKSAWAAHFGSSFHKQSRLNRQSRQRRQ